MSRTQNAHHSYSNKLDGKYDPVVCFLVFVFVQMYVFDGDEIDQESKYKATVSFNFSDEKLDIFFEFNP